MTKGKTKRPLNQAADGSVDARAFLESIDGPLTLGRLLRSIREGEEISLEKMSKQLGVSRAHLCDVEHDRRTVSAVRAARWAVELGYDPSQFVELAVQAELNAAGLKLRVSVDREKITVRRTSAHAASTTARALRVEAIGKHSAAGRASRPDQRRRAQA